MLKVRKNKIQNQITRPNYFVSIWVPDLSTPKKLQCNFTEDVISAVTELNLAGLLRCFLWQFWIDNNCHNDICMGNIYLSNNMDTAAKLLFIHWLAKAYRYIYLNFVIVKDVKTKTYRNFRILSMTKLGLNKTQELGWFEFKTHWDKKIWRMSRLRQNEIHQCVETESLTPQCNVFTQTWKYIINTTCCSIDTTHWQLHHIYRSSAD